MFKKLILCITAMLALCISAYAEDISYDYTQNKINNTDSYSIVKKGEELYFSGEKDFVDISLEKGDEITLLKWNSYADIKPKADPAVYNVCDVLYLCEGKEVAKGVGFAEGELVYPDLPQKDGHQVKWSVSKSGEYELTANAVYTPNKYKITFDASDEEIEVTYGDKYPELPIPENTDIAKCFIGWYNGEEIIAEGNRVEITENVCVVAKWGYKVTYNSYYQDGTAMLDSVIEGGKAIEPAVPEKIGYKFLYWCTDASGDNKYDFETAIQREVTLYPKWESVYYTATFKAEGKTIAEELYTVESEGVTEPEVPAKDWYDGSWETYSLDVGGVTVNAVYTLATYTVSFKADNVEIGTQAYDLNNQDIITPDIPAKAGHRAVWERFEVVPGGMTINVRYISAETDEENAEELLRYTSLETHLKKHNETGTEREIMEKIILVAKGIVDDINYGILINETHIKSAYTDTIKEAKALNATLTENTRVRLKGSITRLFKDDPETFDYFLDFYEKYF